MPRRFTIIALLWLTYALLLGHDLLPHHHYHDGAVTHQGGADADHHDTDQHDDGDEPDWWANHQHSPGVAGFGTVTPTTYQAMPVLAVVGYNSSLPFPKIVYRPDQTVGWPPAQAKAPPGQHRYRPLRAPPAYFFFA